MFNKKLGIGLIIVILGALAFYFLYWTKTPQYSIALIQQAVKNHNVDRFEKYVDLDSVYGKAYDDFIAKSIESKSSSDASEKVASSLVSGFMNIFKPTIVTALKDATLKEISGSQDLETSTKKQKGDIKEGLAKVSYANKNSELKNISVISKESDVARVAITLFDKELNKNFDIKVKMNKLDSGEWRVKEITNLIEYLDAVQQAKLEKTKEIDKTIKDKIDKIISAVLIKQFVNGYGGSAGIISKYGIEAVIELSNLTDQELKDIKVLGKLYNKNGEFVKDIDFFTVKSIAAKGKNRKTGYSDNINKNNVKEMQMIYNGIKDYSMRIYIMSLKTADGTVIERPKIAFDKGF
jgi:hypothetical protein